MAKVQSVVHSKLPKRRLKQIGTGLLANRKPPKRSQKILTSYPHHNRMLDIVWAMWYNVGTDLWNRNPFLCPGRFPVEIRIKRKRGDLSSALWSLFKLSPPEVWAVNFWKCRGVSDPLNCGRTHQVASGRQHVHLFGGRSSQVIFDFTKDAWWNLWAGSSPAAIPEEGCKRLWGETVGWKVSGNWLVRFQHKFSPPVAQSSRAFDW